MSNEPVRNQASFDDSADRPAPGGPAVPLRASLAADAELVLSAIHRIEAAIYNGLATPPMDRLRALADEMAQDIAETRLAIALDHEYGARTLNIETLLGRLDSRIAAMLAAAAPAAQTTADAREADPAVAADEPPMLATTEPDRVPTVSGVVAHLGREAEMPATPPAGRPPSLSILEAMVEALATSANRSEPAEDRPISLLEATGPETTETPTAETISEPFAVDAPASQGAPAPSEHLPEETSPVAAPLADAASALAAWEPAEDEASIGPAQADEPQFFATTPDAAEPTSGREVTIATDPQTEIVASATARPAEEPAGELAEKPAAEPAIEQPANALASSEAPAAAAPAHPDELLSRFAEMESKPYLPQDIGEAVIFTRVSSEVAALVAGPALQAADVPTSAEDDSDGDGDPAGFLLGPAPKPQAPELPPQMAATPTMPTAPQLIVPKTTAPAAPKPADPLAPLRSLSESETVALFS
jgi:hypothetical protein